MHGQISNCSFLNDLLQYERIIHTRPSSLETTLFFYIYILGFHPFVNESTIQPSQTTCYTFTSIIQIFQFILISFLMLLRQDRKQLLGFRSFALYDDPNTQIFQISVVSSSRVLSDENTARKNFFGFSLICPPNTSRGFKINANVGDATTNLHHTVATGP